VKVGQSLDICVQP